MVTEKTPPHKRIRRAEKGREEWKVKATQRREENQRLNAELKAKDFKLKELKDEIREMKIRLKAFQEQSSRRDMKTEKLKKKSPK